VKAVFDTKIFISAFVVPGSRAERAFLLARRGRFALYTSVAILTETARKLREKFEQDDDDIRHTLKMISGSATVLKPVERLRVLRDAPDNRILECAADAVADLVVTGDRHLLKLRGWRGIPLISLADFLRTFPPDLD